MAVIALPLDEVQATVATTTGIPAAVGVTAVVTLRVLAWWSVRRGLRPIDDIISTAADIGAGKWSQRVEITHPHHEVERLGNALNANLGRIENAFNVVRVDTVREAIRCSSSLWGTGSARRRGVARPCHRCLRCLLEDPIIQTIAGSHLLLSHAR